MPAIVGHGHALAHPRPRPHAWSRACRGRRTTRVHQVVDGGPTLDERVQGLLHAGVVKVDAPRAGGEGRARGRGTRWRGAHAAGGGRGAVAGRGHALGGAPRLGAHLGRREAGLLAAHGRAIALRHRWCGGGGGAAAVEETQDLGLQLLLMIGGGGGGGRAGRLVGDRGRGHGLMGHLGSSVDGMGACVAQTNTNMS